MNHCVLEEHQVHPCASHHLVVLRQEHVQASLQAVERGYGLVHFGHLHVKVFRLIASRLGRVSESEKILINFSVKVN